MDGQTRNSPVQEVSALDLRDHFFTSAEGHDCFSGNQGAKDCHFRDEGDGVEGSFSLLAQPPLNQSLFLPNPLFNIWNNFARCDHVSLLLGLPEG